MNHHSVEFNHLILPAKAKQKTADFITNTLGLPKAKPADGATPDFFLCIQFDNNVMILVAELKEHPTMHYAFKVTQDHFDHILQRLRKTNQDFWADPKMKKHLEYYEEDGKKGIYVMDPSGHALEFLAQNDD